mgnify:FL=1
MDVSLDESDHGHSYRLKGFYVFFSGWERAEAEAAEIKEKLEALMEQKLATEDRVSHLDGALKECMKQLRHVREDQENKIHEAVLKNTREFAQI